METTSSSSSGRFLPVLLALIVGVAIGWLVFRPQVPPPQAAPVTAPSPAPAPAPAPAPSSCPPTSQPIVVGPAAAQVTPPCVTVKATEKLIWVADTASRVLWIEFGQKPFVTMSKGKYQPYRVTCSGNRCDSGPILPNAPSDAETCPDGRPCKEYKYWQIFKGQGSQPDDHADGRIIIEW
jgi:hypothetical protein